MTNLTDKLKRGELPDNHHYYFKLPKSKEYEVGNTFCLETLRWCKDGDKIEILGEVPSYNELQKKETQRIKLMTKLNDVNNENHALEIKNTKLKELLKTHKLLFELEKDNTKDVLQQGKYAYLINDIDQALGEE